MKNGEKQESLYGSSDPFKIFCKQTALKALSTLDSCVRGNDENRIDRRFLMFFALKKCMDVLFQQPPNEAKWFMSQSFGANRIHMKTLKCSIKPKKIHPLSHTSNFTATQPLQHSRKLFCLALAWWIVRMAVSLSFGLLYGVNVFALDPDMALNDYGIAKWDVASGLPHGGIMSLTQSADGYLWVGTQDGLARFDGVRFVKYDVSNTPALRSNLINALASDNHGRVWVGSQSGLAYYQKSNQQSEWVEVAAAGVASTSAILIGKTGDLLLAGTRRGLQKLAMAEVTANRSGETLETIHQSSAQNRYPRFAIAQSGDGDVWIADQEHGIHLFSNGDRSEYIRQDELPASPVLSILISRDGSVWIGTVRGGLVRFQGGKKETFALPKKARDVGVRSLLEDGMGNVWIGTEKGLFRYQGSSGPSRIVPSLGQFSADVELADANIVALFEDRESNLWVGTDTGLYRLRDVPISAVGEMGGLGDEVAWTVMQENLGAVWAGTDQRGVFRFDGAQFQQFNGEHGLPNQSILSLASDPKGQKIWAGLYHAGLYEFQNGRFGRVPDTQGYDHQSVYALFYDSRDRLWIGGPPTGTVDYLAHGKLHSITKSEGFFANRATQFAEDSSGSIWVGTNDNGLYRIDKNGQLHHWTVAQGLAHNHVMSLLSASDHSVWIATSGLGINRWKNGEIQLLTNKHGVPTDIALSMLEDNNGRLWLCTSRGIFSMPLDQLNDVASGKQSRIEPTRYNKEDGMRESDCAGGGQPSAWKGLDGRLWFATAKGLARVDPNKLRKNHSAPPVIIEEVWLDGVLTKSIPPAGLDYRTRRIEFRYTAPSFTAPSRVNFRYRLDGFESDWVNGDTARAISYTNLSAGDYRFRVLASNHEGVWNEVGASLAFKVRAPFYKTAWFYSLGAIVAALLLWMFHRQRVLKLLALSAALEERQRLSHELHDSLSHTMHGLLMQIRAGLAASPPSNQPFFERAEKLTIDCIDETHRTLYGLNNLTSSEEIDLAEALRRNFVRVVEGTPVAVDVLQNGGVRKLLPEVELAIFRIGQEAVTNALRHAKAEKISVTLSYHLKGVNLAIEDDGCGFDPNQHEQPVGLGLVGMKRRVDALHGTITIERTGSLGTAIKVFFPC